MISPTKKRRTRKFSLVLIAGMALPFFNIAGTVQKKAPFRKGFDRLPEGGLTPVD
jgi:hypothetical protein